MADLEQGYDEGCQRQDRPQACDAGYATSTRVTRMPSEFAIAESSRGAIIGLGDTCRQHAFPFCALADGVFAAVEHDLRRAQTTGGHSQHQKQQKNKQPTKQTNKAS